jgi:hypothetical protein
VSSAATLKTSEREAQLEAENRRLRLALESIRDEAGTMSRAASRPSHTHALARLGALANEALEET